MDARALVWHGNQDFELVRVPVPELGPDELIVEMSAASICGSDRHTVSGSRSAPRPSILGHEGVGTVIESRRDGFEPGQRVVFSVAAVCGRCDNCQRGLSAKCRSVAKAGHERFDGPWPLSGTFATHMHVVKGQKVSVVPDTVSDAVAATAGCAVATVMAVMEAAGPVAGRTVLVNGVGMLGLVAVAEARRQGAAEVIGCDPGEVSRKIATGVADRLAPTAVGLHADVVLELSGVRRGVIDALGTLNVGGTAVLAGSVIPTAEVPLDPEWIVRGWRTVTGVHNYEPHHLDQAVEFLAEVDLPWDDILASPIILEELPAAFMRNDDHLRVVVKL
ncbi:zinc-binding dehydrogenase [Corynebacterium cystitidis]|uniref:zinc-binding dehydrogenase n=1 Tax=Corynebacterium cystitidis TaxID=35757 RepID=UPI00211E0CAB|nr:zinc-binding dehydrogenase [Corynebacterium cystitidis]